MKNTPQSVDAEVVESDESVVPTDSGAQVVLDLEHMIKQHIRDVTTRKTELKKSREMLQSALTNDETYRTHDEEAKKAAKQKAATKAQILSLPANASLNEKVKELAGEVKELGGALSDYLREYQRMSGVNEIESEDGQVHEIVYTAKLVKKSKR